MNVQEKSVASMKPKAEISITTCFGNEVKVSEIVFYPIVAPDGKLFYKIEGRGQTEEHATNVAIDIREDKESTRAYYIELLDRLVEAQEAAA